MSSKDTKQKEGKMEKKKKAPVRGSLPLPVLIRMALLPKGTNGKDTSIVETEEKPKEQDKPNSA